MPHVFISYRRSDTNEAARGIYDELCRRFTDGLEVFRDIDTILLGKPFVSTLMDEMNRTDAVLAIIGPSWLTVTDASGGRRIDAPDDFVRREIEAAFKLSVPILPVLVANASMPTIDELPPSISRLSDLQGFSVGTGSEFRRDVQRLISKMEEALGLRAGPLIDKEQQILQLQIDRQNLETEVTGLQQQWLDRRDNLFVQFGTAREAPTGLKTAFATVFTLVATLCVGGVLLYGSGANEKIAQPLQIVASIIILYGIGMFCYLWSRYATYWGTKNDIDKKIDAVRARTKEIEIELNRLDTTPRTK